PSAPRSPRFTPLPRSCLRARSSASASDRPSSWDSDLPPWPSACSPSDERVRLFFATDVHGSEVCWRKVLNAAGHYHADTLVLGGDMTGKGLVTIVDAATASGARSC